MNNQNRHNDNCPFINIQQAICDKIEHVIILKQNDHN